MIYTQIIKKRSSRTELIQTQAHLSGVSFLGGELFPFAVSCAFRVMVDQTFPCLQTRSTLLKTTLLSSCEVTYSEMFLSKKKKTQACGVCGFPDCVIWVICDPCFKNKGETPGWKPLFLCVAPSLSLSLSLSDNRSLVFLPLSVPFFMPLITFITSVSHHVLVSRGGN